MSGRTTRRYVLGGCAAVLGVGLAGCADDGESERDERRDEREGADDGDENTGGSDAEPGATDETGGADGNEGAGESSINYENSYVLEIDLHEAGSPDITQTIHEGDVYTRTEFGNGEVVESYRVDGDVYSVLEGGICVIEADPAAENSVPDIENPSGVEGSLSPSETTTIDGESVDVYEHPEDDARWYVSTETGYPVRFEMEVATVTYHSWGATEPITPPDMECREV